MTAASKICSLKLICSFFSRPLQPLLIRVYLGLRMMKPVWMNSIFIMITIVYHQSLFARALGVGVNYGLLGSDLPPPSAVVELLKSKGINKVRIFDPNPQVLEALRGSGINVILGTRNADIPNFANSVEAAVSWANANIVPYRNNVDVVWVTVGNEVVGENTEMGAQVVPAMRNLISALSTLGLQNIVVTTVVSTKVLGQSYPPSAGVFKDQSMIELVRFLEAEKLPLMINLYPYFALSSNPADIPLDFALFTASTPAYTDQGLPYYNLFDAMYDAVLAAMAKALGSAAADIPVIVAETGWPSAGGGSYATIENARIYNNNLKVHAAKGTPKCAGPIDVFFFALFDENMKTEGAEQHFGAFYPNMEPVYPLW